MVGVNRDIFLRMGHGIQKLRLECAGGVYLFQHGLQGRMARVELRHEIQLLSFLQIYVVGLTTIPA